MDIPSNISLPVSSDNSLFDLFNYYIDSFTDGIPLTEYVDVFKRDELKFDLYLKTNKYLGEDIYTLSSVSLNTDRVTIERQIRNGQNNYNPFEGTPDDISYSTPISSTNLADSGATAGTNLSNSDVVWQFVDGTVEGAWLKRSDEEFTTSEACIRLPRGVSEFRFPYANRGLSGEGIGWTGKGVSNCSVVPYVSLEERNLAARIDEVYWNDQSALSSVKPISLNQTQLVDSGAQASKIIEEADQIQVKSTRDSEVSDTAWLFDFDRTELPITCGTNVIYYPLFRFGDTGRTFQFNISPDQTESKPLSSIGITKSMCGAIAGTTPETADQILKQSGQCENPTEGAWLRSCELSAIDYDLDLRCVLSALSCDILSGDGVSAVPLSGSECILSAVDCSLSSSDCVEVCNVLSGSGAARQTGLHMVNRSGDVSHFFWEFDDLPADVAINGYDHDEHCNYRKIDSYSSIINPSVSDELNQWKHCNCKAVYYSPIGNTLDNFESFSDFSDVIYIDSGVEPFSLATWTDPDGNDYRNSDQFGVFKYKGDEPDSGFGIGTWETLKGEPLILKKGNSYVYRRASFGGCTDVTAPPLVVNNCHCYDNCNDNICVTEWVKMVKNDSGVWESTGEITDMTMDAGSFYQYIKRGSIKYKVWKNGTEYERSIETPSFSLNILFDNPKPYWASSPNFYGLDVGISAFESDEYLLTTQPNPSEIVLTDDIYVKYTSNGCDPIIWKENLEFSIDLGIPDSWRKIQFSDESPDLLRKIIGCGTCELVFPDTPNTCNIRENKCDSFFTSIEATDELSDMAIRTPINCGETTQFFYYAKEAFTWTQDFNDVISVDDQSAVSLFSTARSPWGNLFNTDEALVRVHEDKEELKTKGNIGVFKPENVGVNKIECFGIQNEVI